MLKNTAGQKWEVFAFSASTGLPVSGDEANITAEIKIGPDGALQPLADTNPVAVSGKAGYSLFDLSQAETNANQIWLYPESSTPGVTVIAVPGTYSPVSPDTSGLPVTQRARYYSNTQELTLVQRADYQSALDSPGEPVRVSLADYSRVAEGDAVRFGATLDNDEMIQATGQVVDIDGTLYAEIELSSNETDVAGGQEGKWELEHISSTDSYVTPIVADGRLIMLRSHAEASV